MADSKNKEETPTPIVSTFAFIVIVIIALVIVSITYRDQINQIFVFPSLVPQQPQQPGQPGPTPPPAAQEVTSGTVQARINESVQLGNLTITPRAILEESRCPSGVQCIQAGTVRVRIDVASGLGQSTYTLALTQSITTEAETITFVAADPYPVYQVPLNQSDYSFTFTAAAR